MINNKKLVLIIDDDDELRDEILPEFVEKRLNADCLCAKDFESGLKLLLDHGNDSAFPAALIILDMHIPKSEAYLNVMEDGGVQILLTLSGSYNLTACPIVVFTAYPSFDNCVASVKAGASAYIPKRKQDSEGGKEHLERICLQLLKSKITPDQASLLENQQNQPSDDWLQINYQWLLEEFGGKWISLVSATNLTTPDIYLHSGIQKLKDGMIIFSGETFNDVRKQIITTPELHKNFPPIIPISVKDVSPKGDN